MCAGEKIGATPKPPNLLLFETDVSVSKTMLVVDLSLSLAFFVIKSAHTAILFSKDDHLLLWWLGP